MLLIVFKTFISIALFLGLNFTHYIMLENGVDLSYVFLSFVLSGLFLIVNLMLLWHKK